MLTLISNYSTTFFFDLTDTMFISKEFNDYVFRCYWLIIVHTSLSKMSKRLVKKKLLISPLKYCLRN